MGPQRGLDVCADDMFMAQPLLTHAFGFPSLILVGWIPVLLLDLGALGLGLNRASFSSSNQGWFQPLPPVPLDLIFSHTQLYYRMLASQSWKGPLASLRPKPPFLDEETGPQRGRDLPKVTQAGRDRRRRHLDTQPRTLIPSSKYQPPWLLFCLGKDSPAFSSLPQ